MSGKEKDLNRQITIILSVCAIMATAMSYGLRYFVIADPDWPPHARITTSLQFKELEIVSDDQEKNRATLFVSIKNLRDTLEVHNKIALADGKPSLKDGFDLMPSIRYVSHTAEGWGNNPKALLRLYKDIDFNRESIFIFHSRMITTPRVMVFIG